MGYIPNERRTPKNFFLSSPEITLDGEIFVALEKGFRNGPTQLEPT